MDVYQWISKQLTNRKEEQTLRALTVAGAGVDFLSNDYLGLARSAALNRSIEDKFRQLPHGTNGATGSRLLSGNSTFAEELEADLAKIFSAESALLFNSGYTANLALLATVPQRGDTILLDEFAHACMKEGARLSYADKLAFRHNDLHDLEKKLNKTKAKGSVFVVVESVYSMDGDCCPLEELVALCQRYTAHLILDEAHSTGIWGKQGNGLACSLGLETKVFARVHTFGKAMGVHGAVVVGTELLKQYLVNFARAFIYTTALPMHNLVAIKEAFVYLGQNPHLQDELEKRISYFNHQAISRLQEAGFDVIESKSAIQALLIPEIARVRRVAAMAQEGGFEVRPILSPTVKSGAERLRICLHTYNTSDEIDNLTAIIIKARKN